MITEIEMIYEFNSKAGLLTHPYSDNKESAYAIEEALEGFDNRYLAKRLHIAEEASPKDISRAIIHGHCMLEEPISDVDRFDKHLDQIVFAFGALFKLRLSIRQVFRGLRIVMKANMAKLTIGKDEHGKQMKPAGWIAPEPLLQEILDERRAA